MSNNAVNDTITKQTEQTNVMLLIVLLLFLLAQAPRAIGYPIILYLPEILEVGCILVLLEILDNFTNLDISLTFIIYYNMSAQFRSTLKSLFQKQFRQGQ